ncbi:MAG TPA: arylsulfatase [Flavisolibacter sp.]|jgi:arylsulfatase A-like enzyme
MKFTLKFLLFFLLGHHYSIAQKQAKPNIIFILADDLGYGDIGPYGQQKIETPNIDRLAKLGVRFTDFYSGSTVCAPARCSFMTGLHTGHTAVRGNKTFKPEGQFPLPDSIITFPMLLQKAGYITAAFGKWSLGFITTSGDPQKKGFDQFFGYNCQSLAHNYYPDHLWNNHQRIDLSVNLKKDSVYSADLIHLKAIKFLQAKHNKPFFLYLPYTLPHADVFVPHDSVYHYYVKKFNEQPVLVPKSDEEKTHYDPYPHAAFAAMVSRLDKYVGEIMGLLKAKGMEENTLLIFTSDNGPHKEKGGDPVFFNSNANFNGIKRDLYEGGIRVPFIAYQKGVTKGGAAISMPAALWDMYPTFLNVAGLPLTKGIDGLSILPTLKGQKGEAHKYLYWELHESGGKQAVRMGDWKGVKLNVSTTAGAPIELYNLASDPQEKANVATKYPEIVKQIEQIMKEAYVPNKAWPLLNNELK